MASRAPRLYAARGPTRMRCTLDGRSQGAVAVLADVLQTVINGAMAGSILAVPAIGLTAIYAVLRFPNFALASHATIGAFAGYVANVKLGLPILPSVTVAFLAAGLVGVASDEMVLKQFRSAGFITTAIASIALTIA